MRLGLFVLGLMVLCLGVVPAMASMTYGDGGAALQSVLNGITVTPHAGLSSVNVVTDPIADGVDKHWHVTAAGASAATMIVQLASGTSASAFGVYDAGDPSKRVPLFNGAQAPGAQALLAIDDDGRVFASFVDTGVDFSSGWFGYYLDTRQPDGSGHLWYSDTSLNSGEDHMVAIQGTNTDTVKLSKWEAGLWTNDEYILAFEDCPLASSGEYTDFVAMVESVETPVPAAVLLGLLGMGVAGMRLRRFA